MSGRAGASSAAGGAGALAGRGQVGGGGGAAPAGRESWRRLPAFLPLPPLLAGARGGGDAGTWLAPWHGGSAGEGVVLARAGSSSPQ